jgi:hypothetical protein
MKAEVDDADTVLHTSKQQLRFSPDQLCEVVNVGLELCGATPLRPRTAAKGGEPATYTLPELPDSWQSTLDTLRPARTRDQSFWDFRAQEPMPVSFEPIQKLDAQAAQLHLQHPVVQRLLSRFLAQGYSNHDLSRVTILRNKRDELVRVVAFGRLSLFGAGAARLHDELIPVAARWLEGKKEPLELFDDRASHETAHMLEALLRDAPGLSTVPKQLQSRVVEAAPDLFARLWTPLRDEADNSATRAVEKLKARGHKEADQLRTLLKNQRQALDHALKEREREHKQLDAELSKQERAQLHAETEHMRRRSSKIDAELEREPEQIEALYDVALKRFTPVGLVVLWPATR